MSTLSSANISEGSILLIERTHLVNDKIKLHILGVPMNKLGSWLITLTLRMCRIVINILLCSS